MQAGSACPAGSKPRFHCPHEAPVHAEDPDRRVSGVKRIEAKDRFPADRIRCVWIERKLERLRDDFRFQTVYGWDGLPTRRFDRRLLHDQVIVAVVMAARMVNDANRLLPLEERGVADQARDGDVDPIALGERAQHLVPTEPELEIGNSVSG